MTPEITATMPHRVKRAEAMMINPGWTCLDDGEKFTPQHGVTYLWVLTDEDKIVVGVENPWNQLNAFDPSVHDYLMKIKKWYETVKTEQDGYGGHPTLAGKFTPSGELYNSVGKAKIGGELAYSEHEPSPRLILTNKSGRFGRGGKDDTTTLKTIQETLKHVVLKFKTFGLTVHARAIKQNKAGVWEQHWVL